MTKKQDLERLAAILEAAAIRAGGTWTRMMWLERAANLRHKAERTGMRDVLDISPRGVVSLVQDWERSKR